MSYIYSGHREYEIVFGYLNGDVRVRYRKTQHRNFTNLGAVCKWQHTVDGIEMWGGTIYPEATADDPVKACNLSCARSKVLAAVRDHYGHEDPPPFDERKTQGWIDW